MTMCVGGKMDIKKCLGKRIQELRKTRKFTQEKLAEIIGIDVVSLSKIETGRNYPTSENLEKISKALNILPYEFYKFKLPKTSEEFISEIQNNIYLVKDDLKKLSIINNVIKELL